MTQQTLRADVTLDPAELREMVADYRNPATDPAERENIAAWWAERGLPNQFAALSRAADIEKARK